MEEIQLDTKELQFPKYVEIQTRTKCNAYCKICPYEKVENDLYENNIYEMPIDKIKKIIDECAEHKNEISRIIPYLNNEPTLDARFIEILKYIKKYNFYVETSTNGSGLTKVIIDEIIENRLVDNLRVSFFGGNKESYEKIMTKLCFEDSYKKVKYLIEKNNERGKPVDIELVLVLYPNIDPNREIEGLQILFPDVKIRIFGYLDRAGNNKDVKNSLAVEECEEKEYQLYGCSVKFSDERICIMSNGDAVICSQDWNREQVLGNVFNDSIEKVWHSKKSMQIKAQVRGEIPSDRNFICYRCRLANLKTKGKIFRNFKGDMYISERDLKEERQRFVENKD